MAAKYPAHPCRVCSALTTNRVVCSATCGAKHAVSCRQTATRLPVGPVVRQLPQHMPVGNEGRNSPIPEILGISFRVWQRYLKDGVPVFQADNLAVRVGAHPIELWGPCWAERGSA